MHPVTSLARWIQLDGFEPFADLHSIKDLLIVEHSLPINLAADINSRDVGSDILNLNHYYYDDDGYKSDIIYHKNFIYYF